MTANRRKKGKRTTAAISLKGLRSKSRRTKLLIGLCVLAAIFVFRQCKVYEGGMLAIPEYPKGLDAVATNPSLREEVVEYDGMTVSFNAERHIPNWVSWELTRDEAYGTEPRNNRFQSDPYVKGCATPADYRNSGYDRGHMAPAADMKWSKRAMEQSFYLTNICPQVTSLNTGAWRRLEEKCREWARIDSAIIIITGPVMTDPVKETIGDTKVAVPDRFFKVILSPYANPPRAIGFIMNNGTVEGGLQKAAVSVDEVEAITGHDFFAILPDDEEARVESQCNFPLWSTLR